MLCRRSDSPTTLNSSNEASMATRRAFLSRAGAASAATVAFKDHAIEVVHAAGSAAGSASAADLATNEDYWREVQGAFSLDRTMINLNNGGVCPTPSDVRPPTEDIRAG